MANLSKKIGEYKPDGLISDLTPPVQVRARTIGKLSAAATLKRGTIMSIDSATEKLVVLGTSGTTLTPDCILCDDVEVGTEEDVNVAVYTAGCFDMEKCTVAESYTVTSGDYDKLRMRGIVFKSAMEM